MAEQRQVPGPAQANSERIQDRDYEGDFSQLPPEEVDPIAGPGEGPHGSLDNGPTNLPLIVIAVGALIAFSAFGLDSVVPLVIGLVVVVSGAIWAGLRGQTIASGEGLGTVTIDRDDH